MSKACQMCHFNCKKEKIETHRKRILMKTVWCLYARLDSCWCYTVSITFRFTAEKDEESKALLTKV